MKSFNDLKQMWSQRPAPDPATALKVIWDSGVLSELQKEFIVTLLSQPGQQPQQPMTAGAEPGMPPAAPGVAGGEAAVPTMPGTPGGLETMPTATAPGMDPMAAGAPPGMPPGMPPQR